MHIPCFFLISLRTFDLCMFGRCKSASDLHDRYPTTDGTLPDGTLPDAISLEWSAQELDAACGCDASEQQVPHTCKHVFANDITVRMAYD